MCGAAVRLDNRPVRYASMPVFWALSRIDQGILVEDISVRDISVRQYVDTSADIPAYWRIGIPRISICPADDWTRIGISICRYADSRGDAYGGGQRGWGAVVMTHQLRTILYKHRQSAYRIQYGYTDMPICRYAEC
jgi:hypothetical protein